MEINVQELTENLVKAYEEFKNALESYLSHAAFVENDDYNIKKKILNAYAEGIIEGKNETERKANEYVHFAKELDNLAYDKYKQSMLKMQFDKAKLALDLQRDLLRILETTTKG